MWYAQLTAYTEIGAPPSISGLQAHAHVSFHLKIPLHRSILKAQVLSDRSIAALPWPYLQ